MRRAVSASRRGPSPSTWRAGGAREALRLPVCEIDLRPGGAYRFVQRGPDGKDYPFKGVYREIVPPERLVYTQCFDVEPYLSHEELVTVTLDEHDGKTTLTELSNRSKVATGR